MKRWAAVAFISSYLAVLVYGLGCHALGFATGAHPLMYYVVWDMFCGWSSYAQQTHLIAEGESQKYYRLNPAPWGEQAPWNTYGRSNYDAWNNHTGRIATNVLRNTRHEPITRIYVIEENWPKKYDMPDKYWRNRFGDEPKTPVRYCRVRAEMLPCGEIVAVQNSWLTYQSMKQVTDDPRLHAIAARSQPRYLIERPEPGRGGPLNFASEMDRGRGFMPVSANSGN